MAETKKEGDDGGKKILIAGPPYRGYPGMVAEGFRRAGAKASLLEWSYPVRSMWEEVMFYSSSGFRTRLASEQDKRNTVAIENAVKEMEPECMLVMKAVELSPATKRMCEDRGVKLALWAYDSARDYPIISRVARDFDLVYTYEPDDLELLSQSCSPEFLPMAYDPRRYFPIPTAKDWPNDICFIGAIDTYANRRELLRRAADRLKDAEISIWTDSIHWYSHKRLKYWRLKGFRRNVRLTERTLGHGEVNEVYNASKICLNIHHPQSRKAVNPRTFEILGSGGLLLTDRRMDGIKGFEDGRGHVHYATVDELVERADALLNDEGERRRIAAEGFSAAAGHTFEERARRILSDLR